MCANSFTAGAGGASESGENTHLLAIGPEVVLELMLQIGLKAHSEFDFRKVRLDSQTRRLTAETADPSARTQVARSG